MNKEKILKQVEAFLSEYENTIAHLREENAKLKEENSLLKQKLDKEEKNVYENNTFNSIIQEFSKIEEWQKSSFLHSKIMDENSSSEVIFNCFKLLVERWEEDPSFITRSVKSAFSKNVLNYECYEVLYFYFKENFIGNPKCNYNKYSTRLENLLKSDIPDDIAIKLIKDFIDSQVDFEQMYCNHTFSYSVRKVMSKKIYELGMEKQISKEKLFFIKIYSGKVIDYDTLSYQLKVSNISMAITAIEIMYYEKKLNDEAYNAIYDYFKFTFFTGEITPELYDNFKMIYSFIFTCRRIRMKKEIAVNIIKNCFKSEQLKKYICLDSKFLKEISNYIYKFDLVEDLKDTGVIELLHRI